MNETKALINFASPTNSIISKLLMFNQTITFVMRTKLLSKENSVEKSKIFLNLNIINVKLTRKRIKHDTFLHNIDRKKLRENLFFKRA